MPSREAEWRLWVEGGRPRDLDGTGLLTLPPLGPGHDSNDVAAGAAGADEALTLLGKGGVRAVPLRGLGSIGLDLMAGFPAPHDESDVSRTRVAERIGGPDRDYDDRAITRASSSAGPCQR